MIDTRNVGNGQPFTGQLSPPVDVVDSACAPPVTASGLRVQRDGGAIGWAGVPDPVARWSNPAVVSTLNAPDGAITSNMAIVPTNNGKIDAYAAGLTQMILDLSGYFAP